MYSEFNKNLEFRLAAGGSEGEGDYERGAEWLVLVVSWMQVDCSRLGEELARSGGTEGWGLRIPVEGEEKFPPGVAGACWERRNGREFVRKSERYVEYTWNGGVEWWGRVVG